MAAGRQAMCRKRRFLPVGQVYSSETPPHGPMGGRPLLHPPQADGAAASRVARWQRVTIGVVIETTVSSESLRMRISRCPSGKKTARVRDLLGPRRAEPRPTERAAGEIHSASRRRRSSNSALSISPRAKRSLRISSGVFAEGGGGWCVP